MKINKTIYLADLFLTQKYIKKKLFVDFFLDIEKL